jgi:hypothetical protein
MPVARAIDIKKNEPFYLLYTLLKMPVNLLVTKHIEGYGLRHVIFVAVKQHPFFNKKHKQTTPMTFFWILWGFDALIALIFLFFFTGLGDGSVSSFNMGLWLLILAGLTAILLGSLGLIKYNYVGIAKLLLSILAVPGFLYGLMILAMLFNKDWK